MEFSPDSPEVSQERLPGLHRAWVDCHGQYNSDNGGAYDESFQALP